MSDIVERVARAIFEAWAAEESAASTWDDVCQRAKDGYPHAQKWHRMAISEARAAIEAMREPTPKMVEAHYMAHARAETVMADAQSVWNAMIDAALKQRSPPPFGPY